MPSSLINMLFIIHESDEVCFDPADEPRKGLCAPGCRVRRMPSGLTVHEEGED